MMKQLKFSLEDIKAKPIAFLFIFIQILLSLLMTGFSFSMLNNTLDFKSKFDIFENTSKMYFICDHTEDTYFDQLLNEDSDAVYRSLQLYQFISQNKDFKSYSYVQESVILDTKEVLNTCSEKFEDGSAIYDQLSIDKNFSEIYGLECTEGSYFSDKDYLQKQNKIPVILGSNYHKYYKIGDEIYEDHIVIGFLKDKSFYLNPKSCGEVIYLDNYILSPLIINNTSDLLTLDNAILGTTLLTNEENVLNTIVEKSSELKLYDISFKSYTEQLNAIISDTFLYVYTIFSLVFLVLFFSVICIISSFMHFIETHKKEFAVHLLCGAKKSDFIFRIAWQILLIVFLGNLITLAVYGFSFAVLCTFSVSLILTIIILIMPIIKIGSQSVNELLRRSD